MAENKDQQQKILDLQKKCKDLGRKLATEKKIRQEKEKEVEILPALQGKIYKLGKENEVLKKKLHGVTTEKELEVEGLKKSLELRFQAQLKEERLNFDKRTSKYLEEASTLFQFRDRVQTAEEQAVKLKAELKKCQEKAKDFEEKKNRVTVEKEALIKKNNKLSDLLLTKDFDNKKLAKELKEKTVEIQSQTENESKHYCNMQQLQRVLKLKNEQIAKLERERQKSFKKMTSQDNEIARLRNVATETEHRLKGHMNDCLPQQQRLNKKLSETNTVVSQLKDTIKSLTKDTEEKDREREMIQAELSKSQTSYFSVKNQLQLVKQKQADAQTAQAKQLARVDDERIFLKKRLVQILADNEKLEKERQGVFQQQELQRQKIERQEEEIGRLTTRVKNLREQNPIKVDIALNRYAAESENRFFALWRSKRFNARRKRFMSRYAIVREQCRRNRLLCKYKQAIIEKNKEIKELRLYQEAALKYKDAIQELHRCKWDIRELKRQVETQDRILSVCEAKNTSLVEENKRLTLEARAKHTPPPPISTRTKSNCVAKPEVGRSTRFMCSIPQKTEKAAFHLPPLVGKTVALQNLSSRPLKLTKISAKSTQQMSRINQHPHH